MLSLRELQSAFVSAMQPDDYGRGEDPLPIRGNGLTAGQRLAIYRNSIATTLVTALTTLFPAVRKLVGEAFFEYAARAYGATLPSRSGDIRDCGEKFPAFLETFKPAASVPYLSDMARLEWARQCALRAPERQPVTLEQLAEFADAPTFARLCELNPSCRLVKSAFPIHQIWNFCQQPAVMENLTLQDAGENVLVWRSRDSGILLRGVSGIEYSLLDALDRGISLDRCLASLLETNADCDLTSLLRSLVSDSLLVVSE